MRYVNATKASWPGLSLLTLAVTFLLYACCVLAEEPGGALAVKGTLTWTTFSHGEEFRKSERWYSVEVLRGEWRIRTGFADATNAVNGFERVFDGTNLYSLTLYNTNYLYDTNHSDLMPVIKRKGTTNTGPIVPRNDSRAHVSYSSVPSFDGSLSQVIWLAYCSGDFLARSQEKTLPTMVGIGGPLDQTTAFLKVSSSLLDGPLRLPNKLTFWNIGKKIITVVNNANVLQGSAQTNASHLKAHFAVVPADKPYDQGFINATYEVLESQNSGGYSVPKHFVLNVLEPKDSGKEAGDLEVQMRIEGVASSVSFESNEITAPTIGPKTFVIDERVTNPATGHNINYWPNSNRWLSAAEINEAVARGREARHARHIRYEIFTVFGLGTGGLIAFFIFQRRQKTG